MDIDVESDREEVPSLESELYFLIAKFLTTGPCVRTLQVLHEELQENKLLPRRKDWLGNEHDQNLENLLQLHKHIAPEHLLSICRRFPTILQKDVPGSVCGAKTLLGAGGQSLLRTKKDMQSTTWKGTVFSARYHGKPHLHPHNLTYPPNLCAVLEARRRTGSSRRDQVFATKLYSKLSMHCRILGHLSAVYCVAFDRSGKFIITGADEHLVKIWDAMSGRLLATLRGHNAEITDMAVNYENTLIASGSCDKLIRVFSLQTKTPVAVLAGHTGMVTSVQFCPMMRGNNRWLMSTGGDGCVCFWQLNNETRSFDPKPVKFIERSRAGAQMLCSSFSLGGTFVATGSSDHTIRVYCFNGPYPEKICELEAHTDQVDSIQYGNTWHHFVSGSRDGTARIWRYTRQEWKGVTLNMNDRLTPKSNGLESDESKGKLKVTMVSWSQDDAFVVTAVSDHSLKVWNSNNGRLAHVLQGHDDEIFVVDYHPKDYRIILSAGHDGRIILWDIIQGCVVKIFQNNLQGQGHGAVFDCKFSPDGQMFAATDSHGHLLIFGTGSSDKYQHIPSQMFFHTDYRPLIRDANHYVLDEQTQQPPHLMPPPFLVNIDGNPYPPNLQRLVPGREHCTEQHLVPAVALLPSGDQEVLDHSLAELDGEERPGESELDHRIRELQREQDGQAQAETAGENQSGEADQPAVSPKDVKKPNYVVPRLEKALARTCAKIRTAWAEEEIRYFIHERKKKPITPVKVDSSDSGSHVCTRRTQSKKKNNHNYRTRANNTSESTVVNRLTARALYDTEVEEDENSAADISENAWSDHDDNDLASSDYSDWTADAGLNLQPPKRRSNRKVRRRKQYSTDEDDDEAEPPDDENEKEDSSPAEQGSEHSSDEWQEPTPPNSASPAKRKPPPKKKREKPKKMRVKPKKIKHSPRQLNRVTELLPEYRPPEWLTANIPRKAPYFPQMGDEVIYFRQGHELYVQAVAKFNVFEIDPTKNQPWHKMRLREQELVRIVGIKYEIRPPRLCCLKLAFMDPENGTMAGPKFAIKYHDMPDVLDFLVLRQTYDTAMSYQWKPGDRFRSMIDDAWWIGTIRSQEPFHAEFPDSMFQCFNVLWDNHEVEKLSPWDLEPIDESHLPEIVDGSVPVTTAELKSLMYTPKYSEWPACGRDAECARISQCIEIIMGLSIAEEFLIPVDLSAYPRYAMEVAYPIDLNTIKERCENHFYRRVTSIQFDVRCIETNAEEFNEPNSAIVKQARIITELCLQAIKNTTCEDPMPLYGKLIKGMGLDSDVDDTTDSEANDNDRSRNVSGTSRNRVDNSLYDHDTWKKRCKELLARMMQMDDSMPFRQPVDTMQYPNYRKVIKHPMDLLTVRKKLRDDSYEDPTDFTKDVRLIFNNSKAFNTNKKSRIYSMTLRLSAMFEDQIREILEGWKSAKRIERNQRFRSRVGVMSPPSHTSIVTRHRSQALDSEPSTSRPRPVPVKRRRIVDSSEGDDEDDIKPQVKRPNVAVSVKGKLPLTNGYTKKSQARSQTVQKKSSQKQKSSVPTTSKSANSDKTSASSSNSSNSDGSGSSSSSSSGESSSSSKSSHLDSKNSHVSNTDSSDTEEYEHQQSPTKVQRKAQQKVKSYRESSDTEDDGHNSGKRQKPSRSFGTAAQQTKRAGSTSPRKSQTISQSRSAKTSNRNSKHDSSESDNESDSENHTIAKRSPRMKPRASAAALQRRTLRARTNVRYQDDDEDDNDETIARRMSRRQTQKRSYNVDSDLSDDGRFCESVSSRGRVRKLTARARAMIE
ncbi:PH-interacting protein-like [Tubulanus polymorphus]|uniref:PH-interacting protein-like n=1 Tax=Tubulanus polymorphus TaxID=672921 RepID=UPI003DA267A0